MNKEPIPLKADSVSEREANLQQQIQDLRSELDQRLVKRPKNPSGTDSVWSYFRHLQQLLDCQANFVERWEKEGEKKETKTLPLRKSLLKYAQRDKAEFLELYRQYIPDPADALAPPKKNSSKPKAAIVKKETKRKAAELDEPTSDLSENFTVKRKRTRNN